MLMNIAKPVMIFMCSCGIKVIVCLLLTVFSNEQ